MRVAVLLSNGILTAFLVILCDVEESGATPCDTTWIRLVYMLSCGKRKRESAQVRNESFSEPLPVDVYGALDYFRERDPSNPLFNEDIELLDEILNEDENLFDDAKSNGPPWRNSIKSREELAKDSVLITKLVNSGGEDNILGIRGFPDQWDIHELIEQKANENYRREIDRLLEECCKTAQESRCNGDTFRGACK